MEFEIIPEPGEAERAAILAALAAEDAEQDGLSPRAQALLPQREPPEGDEP
jgi:hypothetical protein